MEPENVVKEENYFSGLAIPNQDEINLDLELDEEPLKKPFEPAQPVKHEEKKEHISKR